MSVFAGKQFRRRNGDPANAEAVVNGSKIVVAYFSAHWCPPCRGFTPKLKKFSEEQAVKDAGVCIIFVSCDQDAGAMDSYFKTDHGDYYGVNFDDDSLKDPLETTCEVNGIPALCVISHDGKKMLEKNARADVEGQSVANILAKWGALYK